jgi:hypothetical protein
MAFYLSTKQIPQLAKLSLDERVEKITQATSKLTVPEKTLLNVLKLLVIVPAFALVLRTANDWTSLLWAALIIMLYPFLVRPMQYTLAAKYLPANVEESQ